MTSKEINKLWAETYVIGALAFERVHKFAALVAAAEREACAEVATNWRCNGMPRRALGDAIRARGERE